MRFLPAFIISSLFLPGMAQAASACPYYGGYASVEGKLGSARDIAEVSAFLPVACSEDALLYSDIRFKGDNRSNREGNIGLGARVAGDDGVAGAYGYYDRKKSGVTDKYHNQMTLGAEYLAPSWELRGNAYIPFGGKKSIGTPGFVSDPFLSGTGIFVNQIGGLRIDEKGMHGGDVEAGWRVPFSPREAWLHGAVYAFHGDDAPVIEGARARATYKLTDHVALLAEGQYDSPRGRQGWLGARVTVPFGAATPAALDPVRSRMTASPVRDVDIVTAPKVTGTTRPTGTYAVINADSGDAQRVIYVDNGYTGGSNDGSLERPFTALSDVVLQDNDILYIAHGLGTSAGMNDGLALNRDNVLVIGEGSSFVYDGTRMTVGGSAHNPDGVLLKASGLMPVLSNTAGDGVTITGANAYLSGFRVTGAAGHGISSASLAGDLTLDNLDASNNTGTGIRIISTQAGAHTIKATQLYAEQNGAGSGINFTSDAAGSSLHLDLAGIESHDAQNAGLYIRASNGGEIASAHVRDVDTAGSVLSGVYVVANGGGQINNAVFERIVVTSNGVGGTTGNNYNGVTMLVQNAGSAINDVELRDITADDNYNGIGMIATGGGALSGRMTNVTATNSDVNGVRVEATGAGSTVDAQLDTVTATGNTQGIRFYAGTNGNTSGSLQSSTTTGNTQHGVIVYDDSAAGAVTVDLGGGGRSTGHNVLTGNGLEDLAVDIDGATLFAQNNWWGQAGGAWQQAPDGLGNKPQIYYGAPINDGLMGHWTFDTEWMSNTTAYDRSGNGADGTMSGLTMGDLIAGDRRQALDFTLGDYIDVTDPAIGNLTQISVIASINVVDGSQPIMSNSRDCCGTYNGFTMFYDYTGLANTTAFTLWAGTANGLTAGTVTPQNQWVRLANTYNNATMISYVDNAVDGTRAAANALAGPASYSLKIGRLGTLHPGAGFSGSMDDVRIYNRALTADEVGQLYRMNTSSVIDFSNARDNAP